jgi:hypothetical protein
MLCFGESFGEGCVLHSACKPKNERRKLKMDEIKVLWYRYGTSRNLKIVYILLTLAALVVAGGAPGTGGGNGAG